MGNLRTASFILPVASAANAVHYLLPGGFRQSKTLVHAGTGRIVRIVCETFAAAPVIWQEVAVHHTHLDWKPIRSFTIPLDQDANDGAVQGGSYRFQKLSNDNTAGTYTVTWRGETTAALAYNETAANLQAALEGLSTIGAGNITVTGTNVATDPFRIIFGKHAPQPDPAQLLTITDAGGNTSTIAQLPVHEAYGAGTLSGLTLSSTTRLWSLNVTETAAAGGAYAKPMSFEMDAPCPLGMLIRLTAAAAVTAQTKVDVTYEPWTQGYRFYLLGRAAA